MSCCKGSIPTVELEDWPGEASVLSRFRLYMWTWRDGPQTQLEPGKNGTSFFLSFMDGDGRVRVEGRGCGGEDEGGRDCHNEVMRVKVTMSSVMRRSEQWGHRRGFCSLCCSKSCPNLPELLGRCPNQLEPVEFFICGSP